MTQEEIIRHLNLLPHPEGGYYRETYRARGTIPRTCLPSEYSGERVHGTAIYYMLTADSKSVLHRLSSDEIFHFYVGDPVEMLLLDDDGSGEMHLIGTDLDGGMRPQIVVPAGVWQGARVATGGSFALMGTTVCPGFEFDDFEVADRNEIIKLYPEFREIIIALT